MQRRALLAAAATLPLTGCSSPLDDRERTPTRAVPASFDTVGRDTHPSDDDRASAWFEDGRVVVTGRTFKDGCHELALGDVTMTDRTLDVVVRQRATADLDENDCGGSVSPYRIVLQVARERVDTVAVEHRRPEFGTIFETTVDLTDGTVETRHSSTEPKTAEEP